MKTKICFKLIPKFMSKEILYYHSYTFFQISGSIKGLWYIRIWRFRLAGRFFKAGVYKTS